MPALKPSCNGSDGREEGQRLACVGYPPRRGFGKVAGKINTKTNASFLPLIYLMYADR